MTDSPAAPDRSLKAQPAREDIRNAEMIANAFARDGALSPGEIREAFRDIARLLFAARAKLDGASGPPNKQERVP